MLTTIVATAIVLGILIFVHELGHFLLAKKLGVAILKFSLGFGPKLIGKKIGETEYQIAVFPLGGFVKLLGEGPNEEIKEEDRPRSLWAQPIWKRALIVGAGPFFNLFLAVVLFSVMNVLVGVPSVPTIPPRVEEITPNFPAEQAGLKKGDFVLAIDGQAVTKWDDLSKIIRNSNGKDLLLKVKRNGEILEIKVTPKPSIEKNLFGEQVSVFVIGISALPVQLERKRVDPISALGYGFIQTWDGIELIIIGIVKMIQGVIPADQIGSPIMIAKMAGEQARRGIFDLAIFTAVISLNLGLLNLFPIPILDGGHFLFLSLEAILRRPISVKKMEIAQMIGLVLIILLMLFAIRNDVIRYFLPRGS